MSLFQVVLAVLHCTLIYVMNQAVVIKMTILKISLLISVSITQPKIKHSENYFNRRLLAINNNIGFIVNSVDF